ncbi:hypothetical protein MES4922_340015 [Mesorhizobium ventifaucium]|uniref:Uncharacterized protein n=1 Tax=Mesorhizobium ventifaucium TaxID=666020 RepID=A0ABM9E4J8_9HYPH|nr:hypothetical protein MES4922_340015 [Mesorhizobium ventifaucium]
MDAAQRRGGPAAHHLARAPHTTVWVPALPALCVRTKVNGFAVWRCGGTYHRAYQGRYIVVVVD